MSWRWVVLPLALLLACGRQGDRPRSRNSPATPARSAPARISRSTAAAAERPRLYGGSAPPPDNAPAQPLRSTAAALERSIAWLARRPAKQLEFDAAVGLWHVERLHPTPNLEYTLEIALHRSDRDEDNPLRRLWHPEMVAPQEAVHGWEVPPPPRRINVNRVVAECLHCDQYELRGTTLHYLRGQMRDQGGYHTTHALWALLLAEERACLPHGVFSVVARELVTELVDAQPQRLAPRKTIDLDLFAERLLFVQMARQRLNVAAAPQHAQWVERLVEHQHEDGGIYVEPEPAAQAYHATMMTAWALAQWLDARPM